MAGTGEEAESLQQQKQDSRPIRTMGEYYTEQLLPLALYLGMSSREFWEEDPALLWSYFLAHRMKAEEEVARLDLEAWLHGSYHYEGVAVALSGAFGGKRRSAKPEYPVRPRTQQEQRSSNLSDEEQLKLQQKEMIARIKHGHNRLHGVPRLELQKDNESTQQLRDGKGLE